MPATILFIDDNDDLRNEVSKGFKMSGYNVISCDSPAQAYEKLETGGIDIVLTDICFEGVGRDQVESFLRKCVSMDLPVVILTGAIWEKPTDPLGIIILEKPMFFEGICSAIEKSLERNKSKRVLYVDDNPNRRRHLLKKIEMNGFELTVCTSPAEAEERLKTQRFDVIVTDIIFDDVFRGDVEKFLWNLNQSGLPLIIASGAVYLDVGVKIPREVRLFDVPFDYGEFIAAIKEEASKKRKPMPDEVIHRLANPDWHIETPIGKWGLEVLESGAMIQENIRYSRYIESRSVHEQLDSASAQGDWPRRDLDNLMRKHLDLKTRLERKEKEKAEDLKKKALLGSR